MKPGDKVRLKAPPSRVGILTDEYDGPSRRRRILVCFLDGDKDFILEGSLEKVDGDGLQNEIACLDGARACPPEDVGGISSYFDFYGVSADPGHEDHERLMKWSGGHYESE